MEPIEKNPVNYTFIISAICLFIIGIFIIGYIYIAKTSNNSYEYSLNVYIKAINKVNLSTKDFVKDGAIDAKMVKSNIPSIISTLQKSKDKILILTPDNKLKSSHDSLVEGLTNNINIYTQLLIMLNNPEAADINTSLDNIKNFKQGSITYYSKVLIPKIKIGLQKSTVAFIDSSIYYVDQLIKTKQNHIIEASQNVDFTNGIDEIFNNFQVVKTDFKAFLYSLRNNNGSYDDLINIVAKNKTDLSDVKAEFAKISVPKKSSESDPIAVFNTLKNSINDYNLYLDSFTTALVNEKVQASDGNIDKNIADKLYVESNVKMLKVVKDCNDFIAIYNGFKNIK